MKHLVIAASVALSVAGCGSSSAGSSSGGEASTTTGVAACGNVPAQVQDTVRAIQNAGPFVRRKDGSTYQNRNRALPVKASGFYREYTVKTPGSSTAGVRRVVTGGNPKRHPQWYFYTGDHYDTFCQLKVN